MINEKILEKLLKGARRNYVALMALYFVLSNTEEFSFYGVENFELFLEVLEKVNGDGSAEEFIHLIESNYYEQLFGEGLYK